MWEDGAVFWISLGKKKSVFTLRERCPPGNRIELHRDSWPRDDVPLDLRDAAFTSPLKGFQREAEKNLTENVHFCQEEYVIWGVNWHNVALLLSLSVFVCAVSAHCALCAKNHRISCGIVLLCGDDRCGLGERKTRALLRRENNAWRFWWMTTQRTRLFVYVSPEMCQKSRLISWQLARQGRPV